MKVCKLVVFAYVLYCAGYFIRCVPYYFTNKWEDNINVYGPKPLVKETFFFKFRNSIIQFLDEKESFEKCVEAQKGVTIESEGRPIQNIVLIIGESYNKYHSSLYGYHLDTNPRLSKLDGLLLFDDVISSSNRTSQSFKNFLSLTSVDDEALWCERPLVLNLFKTAGYNVVFYSNQFVQGNDLDQWDASCGFFFHPEIKDCLFSFCNPEKYKYDGELISSFEAEKSSISKPSKNLFIFHLYGQHVYAHMRFPKDSGKFTAADYWDRLELNEEEKQQVADYDNATLYNDYVVSEIIDSFSKEESVIIYFADHGDEVNDFRPHIGRSYDIDKSGASGLHCQMDIPFFVYMTDSFKSNYPDLADQLASSVHKPFMSDNLPYLLLDLSGIKSKWNDDSKSLINPNFNCNRPRRIIDYSMNEQVEYDDVCKAYGEWKIGY